MNYFFRGTHLKKIKSLSIVNTLYAFDYDGTLSKISTKIEDANLPNSTYRLLSILSQQAQVAIVSGRSISDLKKRVRLPNVYLIGNHGLEGVVKGKTNQASAKKICVNWLESLRTQNFDDNIFVEDKKYSISIHFRESKNRTLSIKKIEAAIRELSPSPRLIGGKSVYNLIPKDSPNKGTAILELKKIKRIKNVFYIGDDETDEDVFRLPNRSFVTIRVGQKNTSKAKYYLKGQSEINKLLKFLIVLDGNLL